MAQALDPKVIAGSITSLLVAAALAGGGYLLHKYTGFGDLPPGTEALVAGIVGPLVLAIVVHVVGYLKKADEWIRSEAEHLGISDETVNLAEVALKSDLELGLNELRSRLPKNEHDAPAEVEPESADVPEAPEPVGEPEPTPEEEDPLKGVDAS